MAQIIALTASRLRIAQTDVLRLAIVCGCALALITAGQAFPA